MPWIFDGKASSSLKVSSLENFSPGLGLLLSDYYYYDDDDDDDVHSL